MAFNPYEDVVPGVHLTTEHHRGDDAVLQPSSARNACLENNSIRFPQAGMYALMYTAITRLGAPISFQTATLSRIGDLTETLNWAVTDGASARGTARRIRGDTGVHTGRESRPRSRSAPADPSRQSTYTLRALRSLLTR